MLIATSRTNYRDVTGRNNCRCSVRTLSPTGESGALCVVYRDWSRLRLVTLGFTLDHGACVVARRLQPKPVPVDRTLILSDGWWSPAFSERAVGSQNVGWQPEFPQLGIASYLAASPRVKGPNAARTPLALSTRCNPINGNDFECLPSTGASTPRTMLPSSSSALPSHVTLSSPARQQCFPSIAPGLQTAMVSNSERAPGVAPGDRAQLDGKDQHGTDSCTGSSAVVKSVGVARLG